MHKPTKPAPHASRRWLQVRLSSLLWLTTVVAIACWAVREHFALRNLEQAVIQSREHLAHMEQMFVEFSAQAKRQESDLRAETDSLKQQLRIVKQLETEAQQKVASLERERDASVRRMPD